MDSVATGLAMVGELPSGSCLRERKKLFFDDGWTQGQTPALQLTTLCFIFLICNKKIIIFTLQDSSEI